jgi:F0F1-type ATP synthase assembly protein I
VVWPPKLLRDQSTAERIFALLIGPILLGAICGWLLGVTEIGYTVLTLLAVIGGVAAGYEHDAPKAGALRGLWGGSLFGLAICEVHRLIGNEAKAEVPDPVELVIIVFALIGCALGAFGASRRRKRELSQDNQSSE